MPEGFYNVNLSDLLAILSQLSSSMGALAFTIASVELIYGAGFY